MEKQIISYKNFPEDLMSLSPQLINKLFFYSLFESRHFVCDGFYYSLEEFKKEILNLFKFKGKKKKHKEKRIINSFINGSITNKILASSLKEKFQRVYSNKKINSHEIDCYLENEKLAIEIKRIFETSNFWDYIEGEITKYAEIKAEIRKVLIVFIMISKNRDETKILSKATTGYRNLLSCLTSREIIPKNFEFYITFFSLDDDFYNFLDDLKKRISSII
ncbi:hypothetical protein DRN69_00390 [Candidatus Pacearchaeota archaeon]|nr:MAG: hypothetical protein DRN69_00390 [Candidatus Pacearchaeota archaeon]